MGRCFRIACMIDIKHKPVEADRLDHAVLRRCQRLDTNNLVPCAVDMDVDMHVDMCADMCIDMCIDMCMGMSMSMHMDLCRTCV